MKLRKSSARTPPGGSTLTTPSVAVPPSGLTLTTRREEEEEPDQLPLDFGLIRRLIGYTARYGRKRNWLLFLTVLRSIQIPLVTWSLTEVITGPIARRDVSGIHYGVLTYACVAIITDICFHFRQRLALELGESVVLDLRREVFAHLQRMPMSFYNRTKLGRIISRLTSDIETVRVGVQDVLFVSIVQFGQMLMTAAFMLWVDWVLFSVIAAMAPILWVINRHFRKKLSSSLRNVQESFSRVTSTIAESVSGMRVTQGFVREGLNAGIFRQLAATHSRNNMAVARNSALLTPLLELNSQFFIAVLILLGGWRVLSPGTGADVGELVKFFFLANLFFAPVLLLGTQYNNALTAMAGAERVFRLLDLKPEWEDAPDAIELPDPRGTRNEGRERKRAENSDRRVDPTPLAPRPSPLTSAIGAHVEFRSVSFAYDAGRPVLHEVSFHAEPGQTIALVGHTGSGKSSIINLVSKFYLPTSGQVLIDGHEIRAISGQSLHRQMGIVLQQNFLFSGTILENIRLGRPDATDEEVIAAVRSLDCLDLMAELPQGLGTVVGERGAGISLGQRQVVCFARAMLADPRILILDEATSSIDTLTEARLQQALGRLLQRRTSFVVAHRLSTIRNADLVLVLDHGHIVERGTHDALVAASGIYAGLYKQFTEATSA